MDVQPDESLTVRDRVDDYEESIRISYNDSPRFKAGLDVTEDVSLEDTIKGNLRDGGRRRRNSPEPDFNNPFVAEFNKAIGYYGGPNSKSDLPLEMSQVSYPQINLIPIEVLANANRVWDFCVAYVCTAMFRRSDASLVTTLLGGGSIGTYYLAALTLFYSLFECSVGAIPPLQRVSQELADLFHSVSPTNKRGIAYTVRWPNNIMTMLTTRPYNSFQNPLITTAPWTGGFDGFGRMLISNTIPAFTLDDILEVGPRAFEEVQRYLLGGDERLIPYTTEGPYSQNTSIFAVNRDNAADVPVPGFVQVVNEVAIPMRDYWLTSLNWFSPITQRDGWCVRTVQISTHLALNRILVGAKQYTTTHSLIHMLDIGILMGQFAASLVAADVNSTGLGLEDISTTAVFASQYISVMTLGQLMTSLLEFQSRRSGLLSAMGAGAVLPDGFSQVIGAGSRFVTSAIGDNGVDFLTNTENLSGLSSFEFEGCFHVPLLTSRGTSLTLDYNTLGGNSLLWFLHALYPSTAPGVTTYNAAVPGGTDLPSTLNMNDFVCFTFGDAVDEAIEIVSSINASLQGNMVASTATGGRDGYRSKLLNLTHFLEFAASQNAFNTMITQTVIAIISKKEFDPRTMSRVITKMFPTIMFPRDILPAYQTLYKRANRAEVNQSYLGYRGPTIISSAHKLSANIWAPSEQATAPVHDTLVDGGGNFIDRFFVDGQWIDALSALAGGIGDIIHPGLGKMAKGIVNKVGPAIHKAFKASRMHSIHLAPVTYGLIPADEYVKHIRTMLSRQSSRVVNVSRGQTKKVKGTKKK
jgi:hypothetical protein